MSKIKTKANLMQNKHTLERVKRKNYKNAKKNNKREMTSFRKDKIEGMYYKYVFSAFISMLTCAFLNMTDGFFIAQKLGDAGISAVNLAWPYAGCIISIGKGIGIGASILISNMRNGKNSERINKIKGNAVSLLLLVTLIIFPLSIIYYKDLAIFLGASGEAYPLACEYMKYQVIFLMFFMIGEALCPILRNSFKIKEATIIYSVSCLLNVINDYLLIMVFDMGMTGASIATAISEIFMFFASMYVIFKDKVEKLKLKHFIIDFKIVKRIIIHSISPFGIQYIDNITVIFFMKSLLKYGGIPAQAMYGAVAYLHSILGMLYIGISDGVQPLMSMANGYKDEELKDRLMNKSFKNILLISIFVLWAFYFLRNHIQFIYNLSDDAMKYAKVAILAQMVAMPLYALVKLFVSYNNSVCNIKLANFLVYSEALIFIPLFCEVLPIKFGITGTWFAYPLSQLCITIIALSYYLNRNKKIKNDNKSKMKINYEHNKMEA